MTDFKKLHFIKNEKGALSVEFAGIFLAIMMVLFFIYDFYTAVALQGKLDRATYSVATAFRERAYFYRGTGNNIEEIHQTEVNQLEELLASLMQSDGIKLKVEALYINENPSYPKQLNYAAKSVISFCGPAGCSSSYFSSLPAFEHFTNLAPYSSLNRWIPLYRVSACIANSESLFKKMIGYVGIGDELTDLCSSNIVISRCSGNCQTPSS